MRKKCDFSLENAGNKTLIIDIKAPFYMIHVYSIYLNLFYSRELFFSFDVSIIYYIIFNNVCLFLDKIFYQQIKKF